MGPWKRRVFETPLWGKKRSLCSRLPVLGTKKGGGVKKFLFDLPDPARKPYAAGLTPEADAWAKANKHRIGTHRSSWCRPQYSAFVGNIDMIAELCTLYDDYGLIAYGNTKGAAVQQLYDNLRTRKATVEDALRFLLGYLQKPEEAAAAFGLEEAADVPAQNVVNHGHNPSENPRNSLEKEAADVGINPAQNLADGKEDKSE